MPDQLAAARSCVEAGDHRKALGILADLTTASPAPEGSLELLAQVAYSLGDLDTTLASWERAHREAVASGEPQAAAHAATFMAMHLMMDTGLMAPVRVWARRADQHLRGVTTCATHAWLAIPRAYDRLMCGDPGEARRFAREAITIGDHLQEAGPAAMGRVCEARSLILEGDVAAGLDRLDEAAAFMVSGAVDPLTVGLLYCEVICGWQGLAMHDRAEEVTRAMEQWGERHPALGSVHGRCRVHRAELMRLRGPDEAAEREATLAWEELRPIVRRELGWPLTELGTVRLQRGDLSGAEEAFRAAFEAGWDPQPGFALLLLAKGEVDAARASISDAIRHPADVPSKELPPNSDLRTAPLLAAQAEICIAAGDLPTAREAARELRAIAERYGSRALAARADVALGRVQLAGGETELARTHLGRGVTTWTDLGIPYEAAKARLDLARALRSIDAARASVEHEGATATLARFEKAAVRTGLNAFRREDDGWSVTFGGTVAHLRDLKGVDQLVRLIARPNNEMHVLELSGIRAVPNADLGPLLDEQAKETYRRRLADIDEDIADAEMLGDSVRVSLAAADRDFILRELERAVGLGGRDRPSGSDAERARIAVTRSIRRALDHIGERHPALRTHLDHALRTGMYCCYAPDPGLSIAWEI